MKMDFSIKTNFKDLFEFFSKKELHELYAEKGILLGTLLLLLFMLFCLLTLPLLLICAPFVALNQASKKWFRHKE